MSNELGFRDRFTMVAGDRPYAWGAHRNLPKHFITSCLRGNFKPQKKNLEMLVEATGIPEDWWLNGDGPPPPLKEPVAETVDLVVTSGSKTTFIEAKTASGLARKPDTLHEPSGTTAFPKESVSRYVASGHVTGVDGKSIGLDARILVPTVSFVTRILLVMRRQAWIPELEDAEHSQLVAGLFNMLTAEAGGDDELFDRLAESDGVVESGLRYLWETQRCRSRQTDQ